MNRLLLIGLVLIGASLALGQQEEAPQPGASEPAPFPNAPPQVQQTAPANETETPEIVPPAGTRDFAEPSEPGSTNGPADTGDEARGSGGAQGWNGRRDSRESRRRRFELERQRARSAQGNAGPGSGSATNALLNLDYAAFKIINTLNIFDPNRKPSGPSVRTETPSEYFGLVGTMTYEKGTFAFFSGSGSKYEKVLKVSDSIAGYKIANIDSDSVKLIAPATTAAPASRTATNGLAGLAATNRVAGLAATNRATGLAATNRVAGLAATNRATGLAATNRPAVSATTNGLAGLTPTNSATGLATTNDAAGLAKTSAPPAELVMRMGMQLRRRGDGPWRLSEGSSDEGSTSASHSTSSSSSSATNSAASPAKASGSADGESDVLKRLMERRQKE
jgi:hypothetical protein